MTNPSRAISKGMDFPELDSAVMLPKPASDVAVAALSAPPVATASHIPHAMRRAA
ncbi:unannotated protein [freshwater metagenome]|uniref:Unannotated protein n=1 Tax=freshwater metagenome TaxID=449393 RepID=A0A6J6K3Q1_9ZZZZ